MKLKRNLTLILLAGVTGASYYYRNDIHREYMRAYFEKFKRTGEASLVSRGEDLVRAGKYSAAVTLARRAAVAYPANGRFRQIEGVGLMKSGKTEEGAESILALADTMPVPPVVYEDVIEYLHKKQRYDDLIYVVVRNDPGGNQNILYYFAVALYEKKKFDRALEIAKLAVKEGRTTGDAYYLLGILYEKKGDIPSAVKSLEEARRFNERDTDIIKSLIRLYRAQGRYVDAEKLLRMRYSLR